jgi:hypothetical protein
MKMNRTFRQWRKRVWAGLLVLVALACAEFWMVCRFSHDCARSVAHEELGAGLRMPDNFFIAIAATRSGHRPYERAFGTERLKQRQARLEEEPACWPAN